MTRSLFYCVAVFALASCLDSKENKLQRFLIQGNDMANKQTFGEAKRYYHEALKLDSCFADAWNNLGSVYYREKHFAEALDAYNNALQCRPAMRQVFINRANTLYEIGRYTQALDDINAFAASGRDTILTHVSRGLVFTKMNRYDESVKSFKRALELEANHVETLVNLGTVYYYRKQYDSARFFLARAMDADPKEPNSFNALALVELEENNIDQALRRVNEALALRQDPYFLNNRGYVFLMKNELEKALTDIDRSIGEDPYNAWAYRNKGVYYLKMNQAEPALRLLDRVQQMDTAVSRLNYYLAEAYFLNKQPEKACGFLKKSLLRDEITRADFSARCKN